MMMLLLAGKFEIHCFGICIGAALAGFAMDAMGWNSSGLWLTAVLVAGQKYFWIVSAGIALLFVITLALIVHFDARQELLRRRAMKRNAQFD